MYAVSDLLDTELLTWGKDDTSTANDDVDRDVFDSLVHSHYLENPKRHYTQFLIDKIIEDVENFNIAPSLGKERTAQQYYRAKLYEVITVGDENNKTKLLAKRRRAKKTNPLLIIVPSEQYYDFISKSHISHNHCGRDKLRSIFKNKYFVPSVAVQAYLKLCKSCCEKNRKGL